MPARLETDIPPHDHEIVWQSAPYLLAVPVSHVLGVCRHCGTTFSREQRTTHAAAVAHLVNVRDRYVALLRECVDGGHRAAAAKRRIDVLDERIGDLVAAQTTAEGEG